MKNSLLILLLVTLSFNANAKNSFSGNALCDWVSDISSVIVQKADSGVSEIGMKFDYLIQKYNHEEHFINYPVMDRIFQDSKHFMLDETAFAEQGQCVVGLLH